MDSDNWVVSNLQGALDTWNEKMGEIVGLLTASPADFRGGGIWDAVLSIHGAVQAVALALLVLFLPVGPREDLRLVRRGQAPGGGVEAVRAVRAGARRRRLRA